MRRLQERGAAPSSTWSTMYTHYTAAQHVHTACTHMLCYALPDPTYRLERYMAHWLALRPSGLQPQARPSPGCRT